METKTSVRRHSYQHFKDLQLSPGIFYDLVEDMIAEYKYPGVTTRRTNVSEGGIFSPGQAFLCIKRRGYVYNVCATPFGKSFMVSWWIKEEGKNTTKFLARVPLAGKFFKRKARSKTYYELDMEMLFMQSMDALIKEAVSKIQTEGSFTASETIVALNNN